MLLALLLAVPPTPTTTTVHGDFDGDGTVDHAELVWTKRCRFTVQLGAAPRAAARLPPSWCGEGTERIRLALPAALDGQPGDELVVERVSCGAACCPSAVGIISVRAPGRVVVLTRELVDVGNGPRLRAERREGEGTTLVADEWVSECSAGAGCFLRPGFMRLGLKRGRLLVFEQGAMLATNVVAMMDDVRALKGARLLAKLRAAAATSPNSIAGSRCPKEETLLMTRSARLLAMLMLQRLVGAQEPKWKRRISQSGDSRFIEASQALDDTDVPRGERCSRAEALLTDRMAWPPWWLPALCDVN